MKETYIDYAKLVPCADNPREKLDEYSLVPSIRERGLDKPLLVRSVGDSFTIAQGHRRHKAIGRIMVGSPESFKTHFPKGIPCHVMPKDTTEVDFALAVADHGESRTLSTDWELFMLCKLLTRAGLTRKDVICKMASVLDVAKPSRNPEYASKVNDLFKVIDDPKADTRDSVRAEMEYEEMVVKQHTGIVQRFQSILKLPEKVAAAYQQTCTGDCPDGFKPSELPSLKGDTYKKLYSKENGYLKDIENGAKGDYPLFEERWTELIAKQAEPKTTSKKSRSRSEVVETRDAMESGIAKTILSYAANESGTGVEKVRALDEDLQMLEWLKSEEPKRFKELAKEFKAWISARTEALTESEDAN